jgi:ATP-dependent RNA helicase DDX24/MAK5
MRLIEKIKFNGEPRLVNLVEESILPKNLLELKSNCVEEEKLAYINSYIKANTGDNFLVFVNTINNGKKIANLLTLLGLKATCLHSHQQQKQRFKKLEQFSRGQLKIVISTDLIARGIDIPQVRHVIHYNIPRDVETYVHRCGRTARMRSSGTSYALIGPQEMKNYLNICLKLKKEVGIQDFDVRTRDIEKQSKPRP